MKLRDQLQLKITLEERFRKEVRALFNRMRIAFRIGVSTGNMVRAESYRARWDALLQMHYVRVQKAFRGVVQENKKQSEDDQDTEDALLMALLAWIDKNAPVAAKGITTTTQNSMDDSVTQARQSFSDDGTFDYTDRELAAVSAVILGRKFKGRESSIIMTETQKAAESMKLMEAYSVADLPPMSVVTRERTPATAARKEWVDMGDADVRPGHRASEVEKVDINEAFVVKGEKLMYPGDTFLGASIENTINCRCSSLYIFGG